MKIFMKRFWNWLKRFFGFKTANFSSYVQNVSSFKNKSTKECIAELGEGLRLKKHTHTWRTVYGKKFGHKKYHRTGFQCSVCRDVALQFNVIKGRVL